ncbi:MAG: zinc-binding dehydrogenase [Microthrixaceae bacterium]
MKAAVLRRPGQSPQLEEVQLGPPLPDEVRLEVLACAICRSDLSFIDGQWAAELPAVYGHEAVGRVVEVGDNVKRLTGGGLEVGQRASVSLVRCCGVCARCLAGESVCCDGVPERAESPLSTLAGEPIGHGLGVAGFAEQVMVHYSQVVALPPELPATSAALLGCGVLTGVGAVLNRARPRPGASVVVVGCGGVGLNAVQGARIAHAGSVVAVDTEPSKLALARQLGATHSADPSVDDCPAVVRAANGGHLADWVFVTVGSKHATEAALRLLAPGGSAVLVGMLPDGVTVELDATALVAANQRLLGSKMGSATLATDIPRLVELVLGGELQLEPLVSDTYPLERIGDAIEAARRPDSRRVVLTVDG